MEGIVMTGRRKKRKRKICNEGREKNRNGSEGVEKRKEREGKEKKGEKEEK